ncbi:MAG TPA: hypothetical protein VHK22_07130 [Gaiellaceae bacterium]|nr:hypothetical protein [Gaiellaceae bacterium]
MAEAAALTGLTVDAVRGRVRRGSLRSVERDGSRRIPHSELERAGLLPPESPTGLHGRLPDRHEAGQAGAPEGMLGELLDRLERQSVELAYYRSLDAVGATNRLLQEVAELRARVASLENDAPQKALPPAAPAEEAQPSFTRPELAQAEASRLWLPSGVGAGTAPPAAAGAAAARRPPPPALVTLRTMRFAVEAVLILGAALAAWLAGLGALGVVLVVGGAWLIAALAELVAWNLEAGR